MHDCSQAAEGGTAPHPGDNEATVALGISDNIPWMPQQVFGKLR